MYLSFNRKMGNHRKALPGLVNIMSKGGACVKLQVIFGDEIAGVFVKRIR